ncbi:MAG: diacylglycerol kinase family lipid kinase [Betaproteobacteria bacterium]|jgi:YegS/Rv2252/BmrU family lipid kinase|nr:diacylglycerol kinase family lipid kinase [Betaproteobacteria bacterium]
MNSPWLVVLNPISGQGRAMHHRHEIEAVLRRHGIDFALEISERPGHAIEIVSGAIRSGCRHVLAVGGDGTVNECANGIFRQDAVATTEITLGVMPIGTGNDWARTHRIPKDYAEVAALMAAETSRLHDVGVAEFDGAKRHFINVAGIGFDAHVVEALPDRTLGPMAYLVGLVKGLLSYTAVPLRLTFGERKLEARAFVLFFAIGRFCGNGMNVAPQAEVDDGLFDVTLVQELSRWEVLKSLRKLFDGTLLTHPKVLALREAWGAVETAIAQPVEADGELIGHAPVRFSILPRALRVITPQE